MADSKEGPQIEIAVIGIDAPGKGKAPDGSPAVTGQVIARNEEVAREAAEAFGQATGRRVHFDASDPDGRRSAPQDRQSGRRGRQVGFEVWNATWETAADRAKAAKRKPGKGGPKTGK